LEIAVQGGLLGCHRFLGAWLEHGFHIESRTDAVGVIVLLCTSFFYSITLSIVFLLIAKGDGVEVIGLLLVFGILLDHPLEDVESCLRIKISFSYTIER